MATWGTSDFESWISHCCFPRDGGGSYDGLSCCTCALRAITHRTEKPVVIGTAPAAAAGDHNAADGGDAEASSLKLRLSPQPGSSSSALHSVVLAASMLDDRHRVLARVSLDTWDAAFFDAVARGSAEFDSSSSSNGGAGQSSDLRGLQRLARLAMYLDEQVEIECNRNCHSAGVEEIHGPTKVWNHHPRRVAIMRVCRNRIVCLLAHVAAAMLVVPRAPPRPSKAEDAAAAPVDGILLLRALVLLRGGIGSTTAPDAEDGGRGAVGQWYDALERWLSSLALGCVAESPAATLRVWRRLFRAVWLASCFVSATANRTVERVDDEAATWGVTGGLLHRAWCDATSLATALWDDESGAPVAIAESERTSVSILAGLGDLDVTLRRLTPNAVGVNDDGLLSISRALKRVAATVSSIGERTPPPRGDINEHGGDDDDEVSAERLVSLPCAGQYMMEFTTARLLACWTWAAMTTTTTTTALPMMEVLRIEAAVIEACAAGGLLTRAMYRSLEARMVPQLRRGILDVVAPPLSVLDEHRREQSSGSNGNVSSSSSFCRLLYCSSYDWPASLARFGWLEGVVAERGETFLPPSQAQATHSVRAPDKSGRDLEKLLSSRSALDSITQTVVSLLQSPVLSGKRVCPQTGAPQTVTLLPRTAVFVVGEGGVLLCLPELIVLWRAAAKWPQAIRHGDLTSEADATLSTVMMMAHSSGPATTITTTGGAGAGAVYNSTAQRAVASLVQRGLLIPDDGHHQGANNGQCRYTIQDGAFPVSAPPPRTAAAATAAAEKGGTPFSLPQSWNGGSWFAVSRCFPDFRAPDFADPAANARQRLMMSRVNDKGGRRGVQTTDGVAMEGDAPRLPKEQRFVLECHVVGVLKRVGEREGTTVDELLSLVSKRVRDSPPLPCQHMNLPPTVSQLASVLEALRLREFVAVSLDGRWRYAA